jgi:hypothetical protein
MSLLVGSTRWFAGVGAPMANRRSTVRSSADVRTDALRPGRVVGRRNTGRVQARRLTRTFAGIRAGKRPASLARRQ